MIDNGATKGSIMRTAPTLWSRFATWLVHTTLVVWIIDGLACAPKTGGDTTVLAGEKPKDAGSGNVSDVKADTKVADAMAAALPDASSTNVTDGSAPVADAAPKPTLTSISFTPAGETLVAPMGKVTLKVIGSYSDGSTLDVTGGAQFTTSDPNTATLNGNVVNALRPGKVTIIASFSGLVAFTNITVGEATVVSISLSPSPLTVYAGSNNSYPITAQATMSDSSRKDVTSQVTWTSSDPTVAPVSPSGYVQGLNFGSAQITATLGQIQATTTVNVYGQTLKHITVQANPPVARPGDFVSVEVLALFEKDYTVTITQSTTLESSNTGVLKLSSNGNGIAMAAGKTTITAKLGDQVVGSIEVTVTNATLVGIVISPDKLSVDFPNHGQFSAFVVYSDQTRYEVTNRVSWYAGDNKVGNFDTNDGSFVPYGLGTATISATYNQNMATAQVTVTIGSPTSLAIDSIEVANFGSFNDSATLMYPNSVGLDVTTQVTWVSDDPMIATLLATAPSAGTFLAGHAGTTKMRATLGNLTSNDGTIKVLDLTLLAIDLSQSHLYLSPGNTQGVTANGTFQDGSSANLSYSVTWKTGNTATATVSNDTATKGEVTAVATGNTSLTATLGSVSATTIITVQ
jgi:hypothetical protein